MKNFEVAIIVVAVVIVAYMWWMKSKNVTLTANPTNANSPGFIRACCGSIL